MQLNQLHTNELPTKIVSTKNVSTNDGATNDATTNHQRVFSFKTRLHAHRDAVRRAAFACGITLAAFSIGNAGSAHAETWPAKPIQLIVGNAPGGSNDTFARMLGKRLQESWGSPSLWKTSPPHRE
jgi:hypothetical protein